MSKFSRLFDMASKALNKNSSSNRNASGSGGTDWMGMARKAAEALGGDSRSTSQPPQGSAPRPADRYAPPSQHPSDRYQPPRAGDRYAPPAPGARRRGSASEQDRAAIARYDYLMQTADPHQIERIHQEAFSRLTPAQRGEVEARMRSELPPHERPVSSAAPDLARAAARTEASQPGRMRGMLARVGGGGAMAGAGLAVGGVLAAVAGGAIVSSVAGPLLEQAAGFGVDFDALAEGIDVEGLTGGAEEFIGSAGEQFDGIGEQVSGLGESISNFEIPGLGDFFGR